MALFGGSRDINLFHTINSELLKDIIQTEIAYYKFALEQTTVNVYGEAPGKNYFEPLKIACLIDRTDQSWASDDFGSDVGYNHSFSFLKDDLIDINLKPDIGDVINWNYAYFEINSINENMLIGGDVNKNFDLVCTTHLTRLSRVNLVERSK